MAERTLKRFILIEKSSGDVWAALTDPRKMARWLCDEAEVEARVGGRYDFRGAAVPFQGGGQRIKSLAPNRSLAFFWTIKQQPTWVRIALKELAEGFTRVEVHHHHDPPLDFHLLDDIWKYLLALLKFHVEKGRTPPRIDFTPGLRSSGRIDVSTLLAHPPEEVFAAIGEKRHVEGWLEVGADIDLREGGHWENDYMKDCRITRLQPGARIVIESSEGGTLEWRVEKEGAETRLRLVHSGFGADEECLFFGWAAFLMSIALYLETGRPVRESGQLLIEHEA